MFREIDEDGSGIVSIAEFEEARHTDNFHCKICTSTSLCLVPLGILLFCFPFCAPACDSVEEWKIIWTWILHTWSSTLASFSVFISHSPTWAFTIHQGLATS